MEDPLGSSSDLDWGVFLKICLSGHFVSTLLETVTFFSESLHLTPCEPNAFSGGVDSMILKGKK